MRKMFAILIGGFLFAILIGAASDVYATDDIQHLIIKQFENQLEALVEHCVDLLEAAETIEDMKSIAPTCEEQVFALIDLLEINLGKELTIEHFDECVYNEALDHTECFDPINIID